MTQCRFCPREEDHTHDHEFSNDNTTITNNHNDIGTHKNDKTNKCTHWAHKPEPKKTKDGDGGQHGTESKMDGDMNMLDQEDSMNFSETPEDYDSADDGKITYNTRKRKRNQIGDTQENISPPSVWFILFNRKFVFFGWI